MIIKVLPSTDMPQFLIKSNPSHKSGLLNGQLKSHVKEMFKECSEIVIYKIAEGGGGCLCDTCTMYY